MTDCKSGAYIWVLGGTSEGRELCVALDAAGIACIATVVGDYGGDLIAHLPHVWVRVGKLDEQAMEELLQRERILCAIDGTHPYACRVSENARSACEAANVPYIRISREAGDLHGLDDQVVRVASAQEAAEFLSAHEGKALLATGVNSLPVFSKIPGAARRFTVRVLPDVESLQKCADAGFPPDQIIAMKGPFSRDINEAMLRTTGAKYLVSKDGGGAGGLREKAEAAVDCGVTLLLIERPDDLKGVLLEQAVGKARQYWKNFVCGSDGPEDRWLGKDLNLRLELAEPAAAFRDAPYDTSARFPFFLNIARCKTVIAGGGRVAVRRARALLEAGADVTAVAPLFCREMPAGVTKIDREWRAGDARGAKIVLAATSDAAVNAAVIRDAPENALTCCCDDPALGNFHFPAVYRKDGGVIGMLTGDPRATKKRMKTLRALLDAQENGEDSEKRERTGAEDEH